MSTFQDLTVFFYRQWYRTLKFFDLLKDKKQQISTLANNEVLNKAVISPVKTPTEGSRYQIGDHLFEYLQDGKSRHLKIFGVQSGGFSNVYTVIDLNEMKPYCLKENRALPGDETTKNKDLKTEAEISLRFGQHPHLVTTHSVFYYRNRLHLLNEYISGTSLDFQLKGKSLELVTALKYALHICWGMLHAQSIFPGFIHGDIKPGNCLITDDGQLKLSDFGQSTFNKLEESDNQKLPGGTYYYMAPELFDSGGSNRKFSDIYAFGITLFEMLTGVRPFRETSKKDLVEQHKQQPPPLNILVENNIPESVVKLVSDCLEKVPTARPANFAVIKNELERIYQAELKQNIPEIEIIKPSSDFLCQQGGAFSILGNYEQALNCYNEALKESESSAEILAQKALLLFQNDQSKEALKLSLKALSLNGNSFSMSFIHAKILFGSGFLNESLTFIERALKKEPENISALNLKGEILFQLGRIYDARKCFEKSIVLDNSQTKPFEKSAEIYLSNGYSAKAVKITEKGLRNESNNIRLLKVLGDAYKSQNQTLKAIESYKKLLRFSLDDSEVKKSFIDACIELIKSRQKKAHPKFIELLTSASNLFYQAIDKQSSTNFIQTLIEYLDQSDSYPFTLWLVDDAVISASDKLPSKLSNELFFSLSKITETEKNLSKELLYSIGKIYYQLEKIEECRNIFNQSLAKFGGDDKSYYYIAACYEIKGEFESALAFYNKALQLDKFCELNRTGANRVSAKLKEKDETIKKVESKNYFLFRGKNENYI